jgi:hypothetical protein
LIWQKVVRVDVKIDDLVEGNCASDHSQQNEGDHFAFGVRKPLDCD